MIAVLLTGGKGKRLSPITNIIPKALIEVKGIPLIDYFFMALPEAITEVYIVLGHLGTTIRSYVGHSYGKIKIKYFYQKTMNGSMGALCVLENVLEESFLLFNCDSIHSKKSIRMLSLVPDSFLVMNIDLELAKKKYPNTSSTILTRNINHSDCIMLNTGCYHLTTEIFSIPSAKVARSLNEYGVPETMILNEKIKGKKLYSIVETDFWFPVGTHCELSIVEDMLKV